MQITKPIVLALCLSVTGLLTAGCQKTTHESLAAKGTDGAAGIRAERAKLSPEDHKLVDAQEWCAVSNEERLGAMGPPVRITIKGEPVFLCCEGCKKNAMKNEDATLAKVNELKAKKLAESK